MSTSASASASSSSLGPTGGLPSTPASDAGPQVVLPDENTQADVDAIEQLDDEPDTFNRRASILGASAYGIVGAALWALVTYVTEYELGLLALVLGAMVGIGATKGGRTTQSQTVGAIVAGASYFLAQLMVVTAYVIADPELSMSLPAFLIGLVIVIPQMVVETFSSMGVLFLGFAVYEGYKIPGPR